MSGDLNNGLELFPFHLVGKFACTEAKYLLFSPPMYSAILAAILKAWLPSLTSLCPSSFPICCCLVKFRNYTSNNLSITVLAAGIEVQGIRQEKFLFMDSLWRTIPFAKNRRIKSEQAFPNWSVAVSVQRWFRDRSLPSQLSTSIIWC